MLVEDEPFRKMKVLNINKELKRDFMVSIITRRLFLKVMALTTFLFSLGKTDFSWANNSKREENSSTMASNKQRRHGTNEDGASTVYISQGKSPEDNIKRAVESMGGIEKYIAAGDIVILKPNAQWWNQGTTNTNNLKGFIELVLSIPDFSGEIIIAENHHYKELNSRGWNTKERNGDYNLNELVKYFNDRGFSNVTKYHWVDAGPNPQPQEGTGGGGRIVRNVTEGDGYVWLEDEIYVSPEKRKCMMTYPVFTSSYSGAKIDLKRGSYKDGTYIENVKLINFSCLNHHSSAFGVTASIKNLMGIVDLTCGYHGTEPKGFYNIHFIGEMSSLYQMGNSVKYYGKRFGFGAKIGKNVQNMGYWNNHYTGGSLGYWMKTVKMPDLNILAAEYVGWGGRGRNGPHMRARANAVAISTDPVALDYIGARNILLAHTPKKESHYRHLNNPDHPPFNLFLRECHNEGIGNLDIHRIKVIEA